MHQYRVVETDPDAAVLDGLIEQYAADGWELMTVVPGLPGKLLSVLRRPRPAAIHEGPADEEAAVLERLAADIRSRGHGDDTSRAEAARLEHLAAEVRHDGPLT